MSAAAQTYVRAMEALNRGDADGAWTLAQELIAGGAGVAGVHFVAGVAAAQRGRPVEALHHLGQAHALEPAQPRHAAHYAQALAQARRFAEALRLVDACAGQPRLDAGALTALAQACTLAGEHERALPLLQRACAADPRSAAMQFNLATGLLFAGRLDAAGDAYEACLARQPLHGKAHLGLAHLRDATPGRNHVERLRRLLAGPALPAATRMHLHLALAKELEDLGDFPASLVELQAGKALGRGGRGASWPADRARMAALLQRFPSPLPLPDAVADGPIFVVGMPRTGTTLVDRVLSRHPRVRSLGERLDFPLALRRAARGDDASWLDPAAIARTQALDWRALGADYLARVGSDGRERVVDKFPHNFLFLPFIAQALPQARFACLRREPVDSALSNFRQLFDIASPFHRYSFDLDDCGRQVLLFERLLARWREVLPGRILDLDYEALVADPEAQVRRLLEFCGLEWDARCLDFTADSGAVATASAAQVRAPLHARSIGRWQRYGPALDGLRRIIDAGLDAD